MGLSNEVLCILVAQEAAKLPEFKVGVVEKNTGLDLGPHSIAADRAERQLAFGNFAVS